MRLKCFRMFSYIDHLVEQKGMCYDLQHKARRMYWFNTSFEDMLKLMVSNM